MYAYTYPLFISSYSLTSSQAHSSNYAHSRNARTTGGRLGEIFQEGEFEKFENEGKTKGYDCNEGIAECDGKFVFLECATSSACECAFVHAICEREIGGGFLLFVEFVSGRSEHVLGVIGIEQDLCSVK